MATVRDIVEAAYRHIGVAAIDEALSADQAAFGLDRFNDMLSAWALDGITLSPAFTDAALTDTFPLADKFREGTAFLLASRLSHSFAMPPTFDADGFFRKIQADYMVITVATADPALTYLGSTFRANNP